MEYTEKDAHDHSPTLRQLIQGILDAASPPESGHDAILPGVATAVQIGESMGTHGSYQQYVEQYGEENAKYIMESLSVESTDNRLDYIDVPEFSHLGYAEVCTKQAEADGRDFIPLPGDLRLIRMLTNGDWNDDEFLVVEPGQTISSTYDWDKIVSAE